MQKITNTEILTSWLPLAGYMFLIFMLSSKRLPDNIPALDNFDKLAHLAEYAILSVLLYRFLAFRVASPSKEKLFILTVILAGLYGISDEIHQSFVPGRNSDALDVLADITGALAGTRIYIRYFKKNPPDSENRGDACDTA